jgi:hypothetical protein
MLCLLVFSVARAAEAAIVIDGIVNEPEWATATSAVNTVTSNWTPADRLDRIRAFTDADYLYIAIDGEISVNAIILYVDSNPGDCSNLASCLTDNVGVLDDALSSALVAGAPFTADFGWGTRDMNRSSTGSDDRLGWRDLKQPSPSNFGWLYGTTFPSACGGGACETKIPLAILGGSGAIKLFARLGVPNGNYISNQNLPMDNPANPQAVNVWMGVPRSTPTPVPELLPMKLRLHPCQPNPFNPQTTVKYDLPEAGPVRLSVFDVAGRLVRTLVDESMPQGSHEVVWDERDATGREVGSGSYLARLEFGGKVETMTIGLVR